MSESIPIAEAAAKHQIPERTLRAVIARDNLRDPLSWGGQVVDDWRLAKLAGKCAAGRASGNSMVQS